MHLRVESSGAVVPTTFDEDDLCLRVLSEYREMPGMNLTLPQGRSPLRPRSRALCTRAVYARQARSTRDEWPWLQHCQCGAPFRVVNVS